MISINRVRPACLGSRLALYIHSKQIYNTNSLQTRLPSRKYLFIPRGLGVMPNPAAAIRIDNYRRDITAAATTGGGPSKDEDAYKEIDYLLREESFNLYHFFPNLLRRALAAAAVLSSLALAFLALTPTLISHPSGLRTVLQLVNATVPAVTVEVDSLKAGWRRPIEVNGIKIVEKQHKHKHKSESSSSGRNEGKRTLVEVEKIKTTATLLDFAVE
jgi:hypothetical protein